MRCAHNPPPCRFFISWILGVFFLGFSGFWVTRFYWFWMILDARGLFFWWFLSILGAWEPLLEAWSIFWPKARIFVILETSPPRKTSPFWSYVWYFLHSIFSAFLSVWFSGFFVSLGAQRLHFGMLFGSFLGALGHWKVKTKKCVWTAQACADCISSLPEKWLFRSFLVSFLRVLSGRPSEHDFFGFRTILGSLGMTIWLQKVIKKRTKKVLENRDAGLAGNGLWVP